MSNTSKLTALKSAFPYTIPIMTGYLFLGVAYGFLMHLKGFGIGITTLISVVVFAGSMQYVGLTLLTSAFSPLYALALTLMVNARHIFYGIAMLNKYKGSGWLKFPLIFTLADEAFSINCSITPPDGVEKRWFYFFVSFLNYIYWIMSCIAGNMLGNIIAFNTKGLDFVLTALFVVIFINQWREQKSHISAIIGLTCSVISLLIFGQKNFMIPAMLSMVAALILFKKRIEREAV